MKFTSLVSAAQLAQHLNDPDWIIFDCRFTLSNPDSGRQAHQTGHIPGARYAHLNDDLSSEVTSHSGRHPLPDAQLLAQKLGKWGVDSSKQVIVYDDSFGSMASRMWWLLRWLGHESVALLDGGIQRWIRDGHPMTAEMPAITPTEFVAHPDSSMWVDAKCIEDALRSDKCLIIDARSEERFSGEREVLDKVAGHIPGSINYPFEDNLDMGGTYMTAEELREAYLDLLNGVEPQRVVHMCGSGVTACHSLIAMEHAGLKGARLYPGSWSEWITDPGRPVETGE
ncbi:MAG: sulfurtransferase [Sulfurimicrobium sp.]|nr:sulfurtransferase [Sulfurimicrobium sp.]MDP1705434.1 sulfurtransferase [Sulfurimicrobium sp.]MDP2198285.1 sulfurtransferase [Sulfurimicrobium sp.]MDP3688520.1 sulfurtransferase [Sulfurimicrobium sp.]